MRIFVTGASGHIGSAVVPELIAHGHQVIGLARSDASAATLEAQGAEVARGDLSDPVTIASFATESDGVIHLAFDHAAMRTGDMQGAADKDDAVTRAIGDALAGSGKPFVSTGGTLSLAFAGITGRAGTEEDRLPGGPRVDVENAVLALADRDVRSSSIRLAPVVHSDLDHHGFVPTLIGLAREHGSAAYIAGGENHWPAVDTRDAARLYRLAVESGAPGTLLHAVGEPGIPFRAIAEAIGRGLGVPAVSVSQDEAADTLGFLAAFAGADNVVSSARTQLWLDWTPTGAGLIGDIDAGHYFA